MPTEHTKEQQRQIRRIVLPQGANCSGEGKADICLHTASDDYGCGQIPSLHLCCQYFIKSVLLLDPALEAALTGNANIKKMRALRQAVCTRVQQCEILHPFTRIMPL